MEYTTYFPVIFLSGSVGAALGALVGAIARSRIEDEKKGFRVMIICTAIGAVIAAIIVLYAWSLLLRSIPV